MTDDTRPEWKHETPEPLARWLVSRAVTKITHHWRFTGEDTSENWIELHTDKNEKRRVASGFLNVSREFEFCPDHARLVRERTYSGVRESIEKIDAWEKKNARDRSEYERLKVKFGG